MYRYETHMHTLPVSKCAMADVRESLEFYKNAGYAGVFITNHFLDGNIDIDQSLPYEEQIAFYFSDYEAGKRIGEEIGLQVLCGVELSDCGMDFLIYGLDADWYLAHSEILDMKKTDELKLMMDAGALVIHAHPCRDADGIDYLAPFSQCVHGAEIDNASRTEHENRLAKVYSETYDLLPFAGSDNHRAGRQRKFAGVEFDTPLRDEWDFVQRVKYGQMTLFRWEAEE